MEQFNENVEQNPLERLSPKEKFETLLGLFGTEQARQNFISLSKEYYKSRSEQIVASDDAENYRAGKKKVLYSPPKRAHLHNSIMDIINRLTLESKNLSETQQAVLKDFHSRENVAQAIKEFVLDENEKDREYYEEEDVKKRGGMSGPAYFHSLGREH